jgi:hypothetical protein
MCPSYYRVSGNHTLRVKSHSACGNRTQRAAINLVRVESTLVRVGITLVRVGITFVFMEITLRVGITLESVEITVESVVITFVRVKITTLVENTLCVHTLHSCMSLSHS